MLAERDLSVAGLRRAEHQVGLWHAIGVELGDARRPSQEHERRHDPDHPWTALDEAGETCPQARRAHTVLGRDDLRFEAGASRPEHRAAEEQQQRRQQGESREHREHDADRRDRPQGAVRLQIAEQQTEESGDHGAARRDDRFDRALPCRHDRRSLVLRDAQFLAETRDEQQRVIGGGADHEDEEDPLCLTAEQQHLELRQPPHHEQSDAEGEQARRQHDEWQEERSVDQHQDDEDREEGDAEEQPVDAGETGHQVGAEAGGSCDVHGDPVGDRVAQFLAESRRHVRELGIGVDRDERLHRLPVIGGERRRDLVADAFHLRRIRDGVGDRVDLRRRERVVGREHGDRRDGVAVVELPEKLLHLGGIRRFGEVGRLLVGGHLVDLAEQGPSE